MISRIVAVLALLLAVVVTAMAQPGGQVFTQSPGYYPGQAAFNSMCLDTANKDTGVSRSAAGVLRTDNCSGTAATSYAAKYTTTGTGTFTGLTLNVNDQIGLSGGATLAFSNPGNGDFIQVAQGANDSQTSGALSLLKVTSSTAGFVPGSGSASFAGLHVNPTVNGTSSGTAYGFGVASKTNTLTGGTVRLASFGTTTTDLFTGYSELAYVSVAGQYNGTTFGTATNCSSSGSPAVCASAAAGSAVIAASATSVVVNTTAVTANSQIMITEDQSLGTKLSVTCNTQSDLTVGTPEVSARSAGTSFTVIVPVAPTTNPVCFSYLIVN